MGDKISKEQLYSAIEDGNIELISFILKVLF